MQFKGQEKYYIASANTSSGQSRYEHGVHTRGYTSRVDGKGNTIISRKDKYNGDHEWISPGYTGATTENYAGKTIKNNGFVYSKKNSDDEEAQHIATNTERIIKYTNISYRGSDDWEGVEVPIFFNYGTTTQSTTNRFISTTSTWEETYTKDDDENEITYYSTKFTSTNFEKTFLKQGKTETSYQKTFLVTKESYMPSYIFTFMTLVRNKSTTIYTDKTSNAPRDDDYGTYLANPESIFSIDYVRQSSLWNNRGDVAMFVTQCVVNPAKLQIENLGEQGERVANTTKYGKSGAAVYSQYPKSTYDTFSRGNVVINLPESDALQYKWQKERYDNLNERAQFFGNGEPAPDPPSVGAVTRQYIDAEWYKVRKTQPHVGFFKTIYSDTMTYFDYDYDSTILIYDPDEGTFETAPHKVTSTGSYVTSEAQDITDVSKMGVTSLGKSEYTISTAAAWRNITTKVNNIDFVYQSLQTQKMTLYRDEYYGHKFEQIGDLNTINGEGDRAVIKRKPSSYDEDYHYKNIFPRFTCPFKIPGSHCLVSSHQNNVRLLGSDVETYFKIDSDQSANVGNAIRGARGAGNGNRNNFPQLRLYETDNEAKYYFTHTSPYFDHTITSSFDSLIKSSIYRTWNSEMLGQLKEFTQAKIIKNSDGDTVIKSIIHNVVSTETKSRSFTYSHTALINAYNTANVTGSATRSSIFWTWETARSSTGELKTLSLDETDYGTYNHIGQFGQISVIGGINSKNEPLQCHINIYAWDELAVLQTAIYTKYSTSIDWEDWRFSGSVSTAGSDLTIVRKKPVFTASSSQDKTAFEISKSIEDGFPPIRQILRKPVTFSQKNTYTEIKQPAIDSNASKVYSKGMGYDAGAYALVWNGEEFIDEYQFLRDN